MRKEQNLQSETPVIKKLIDPRKFSDREARDFYLQLDLEMRETTDGKRSFFANVPQDTEKRPVDIRIVNFSPAVIYEYQDEHGNPRHYFAPLPADLSVYATDDDPDHHRGIPKGGWHYKQKTG